MDNPSAQGGNSQVSPQQEPPNEQPQTPNVAKKCSWWQDIQRNGPQKKSLLAASFVFMSGGMSLACSIGFEPVYENASKNNRMHMQICWFVAVIIGATIAVLLIDKIQKRIFNLISSVLVIINGILLFSIPDSSISITFARYFDGIAFGLTLISAIVAGSEQAVKRFRGLVLSVEQYGLITGMMLKMKSDTEVNTNEIQGFLALIFGIIALLFTFFLTIESPVFFLRKNKVTEAIYSLCRLQKPCTVITEIKALLNENKQLLEEDIARGRYVNVSTGWVPMIKMCIFRSLVSMSCSLPLAWAFGLAWDSMFKEIGRQRSFYLYATMRLLGIVLAMFSSDTVGRKVVTAFALFVSGGLMIGLGLRFLFDWDWNNFGNKETAFGLLMAYQVFAGMAAPASTCYLGEAFSISVKPYFILFVVIVENVVQIIICCTFGSTQVSLSAFIFVLGSLQIAFSVFFVIAMPETKNTTLRVALIKFKMFSPKYDIVVEEE